jgi:hypothetical protein
MKNGYIFKLRGHALPGEDSQPSLQAASQEGSRMGGRTAVLFELQGFFF